MPAPLRCSLSIFFLFLLIPTSISRGSSAKCSPATGPIAESTPLLFFLQTLQRTAQKSSGPNNFGPKRYVDLSLKPEFDLQTVKAAFKSFKGSNLEEFIGTYFNEAGYDLELSLPGDFSAQPKGFLPKVKNAKVRKWVLEVHSLWKNLSRKVSPDASKNPEKHTLLALPELVKCMKLQKGLCLISFPFWRNMVMSSTVPGLITQIGASLHY